MGARFRSWWQKIKRPLLVVGIIVASMLVIVTIVGIIGGYLFNWNWAGLRQKTLWDWLQLLIIPAVLAVGGFVINLTISRSEQEATKQRAQSEREIAEDNQREAALQAFIDKLSELLLEKQLRQSTPEDEVRKIARVRTLTVLPRLDKERKRSVVQFLHESGLIKRDKRIVDLRVADLSEACLYVADLSGTSLWIARLSEADLSEVNLYRADLRYADLRYADLSSANLYGANLYGADLSYANLIGANVSPEQWNKAKSLQGVTMPDGSIHP